MLGGQVKPGDSHLPAELVESVVDEELGALRDSLVRVPASDLTEDDAWLRSHGARMIVELNLMVLDQWLRRQHQHDRQPRLEHTQNLHSARQSWDAEHSLIFCTWIKLIILLIINFHSESIALQRFNSVCFQGSFISLFDLSNDFIPYSGMRYWVKKNNSNKQHLFKASSFGRNEERLQTQNRFAYCSTLHMVGNINKTTLK